MYLVWTIKLKLLIAWKVRKIRYYSLQLSHVLYILHNHLTYYKFLHLQTPILVSREIWRHVVIITMLKKKLKTATICCALASVHLHPMSTRMTYPGHSLNCTQRRNVTSMLRKSKNVVDIRKRINKNNEEVFWTLFSQHLHLY